MIDTQDAIYLYQTLRSNDIQIWLTGGWGIDALLGEQTRPHKDLDIFMLVDDVVPMRALLEGEGYSLKELWSENRWTTDTRGTEIPTAFVLWDAQGREVDAHALRLDEQGCGVPAWTNDEGLLFTREGLSGQGRIGPLAVRCLSPAMQMRCHTGYDLPDAQRRDLERLHARFGVERLTLQASPRESDPMQEILNYLPISDTLGTAGQPTPGQFAAIRAAGYQLVVNLAMPGSTDFLPDEGELVAAQGMAYIHIPVVWQSPAPEDLARFFAVLDRNRGRKVLVHCALNMRVSCFVFLYRVLRLGAPRETARRDVLAIWEPNATWQRFIDAALARET
jgi:protein tyrosine phosphatase (PTP) superfamily phosphohydrolase (DUF442 family)